MLKFVFTICLFGILAESVRGLHLQNYNRSLNICPNEKHPGKLFAKEHITKILWNAIDVRIPDSGLLDETISCILIIDNNNSGNTPVIKQGGVGSNYVEIRVPADLISGLNFNIEVYVKEKISSTTPTTTNTKSQS